MSREQSEKQTDECDRCGDDGAEHLVIIQANYLRAHRDRRPLCDDCLEALGEWWRSVDAETELTEGGR